MHIELNASGESLSNEDADGSAGGFFGNFDFESEREKASAEPSDLSGGAGAVETFEDDEEAFVLKIFGRKHGYEI